MNNGNSDSFEMLEVFDDAVIVLDNDARIRAMNATARELFECGELSLVGKKLEDWLDFSVGMISHANILSFIYQSGSWKGQVKCLLPGGKLLSLAWKERKGKCPQENTDNFFIIAHPAKAFSILPNDSFRSDERIRLLINHASFLFWAIDTKGIFTLSEGAGLEKMNFAPGEAVGLSIFKLYKRYPEILWNINRTLGGDTTKFTTIIHETVWEVSCSPVFDVEHRIVGAVGFAMDITERYNAENSLKQSELLYNSILNSINDWIFVIDRDFNIEFINNSLMELTQKVLGTADIVGKNLLDIFPEKGSELYDEYLRIFATGIASVQEEKNIVQGVEITAIVKKTPVFDGAKVVRIVTTMSDVTQIKQAQQSAKESQALLRTVLDLVPTMIYAKNKDGRYIMANRAVADYFGVAPDALLEITPDALPEFTKDAQKDSEVIRVRKKLEIDEEETKTPDGEPCWLSSVKIPMTVNEETVALSVVNDITNRKKAELDRLKLEQQLIQSQKMEAVGQLAGGIAHDFNNLLTGISGHVSLALMDLHEADPLYKMLQDINKAAARAAGLTKQLLAFSRKQIIEPRVINLNKLIENLHNMLIRIIGDNITLQTYPAQEDCKILADPNQVEQVIVNLLVNARDAMPKGGTIKIFTNIASINEERAKAHPNVTAGGYAILSILDQGEGMTSQVMEHLFEPFFTTKELGHGTGLGLATVYGIVDQHDGFIEVDSAVGFGSRFDIYFPLEESEADEITGTFTMKQMPVGNETILIVEDEEMVRQIAVRTLSRLGYKILEAESGEAALRMLEEYSGTIHLIMTDVSLPGISGVRLVELVKKENENIGVVFSSGYTDQVLEDFGLDKEKTAFMQKPFLPIKIAETIRAELDEKKEK